MRRARWLVPSKDSLEKPVFYHCVPEPRCPAHDREEGRSDAVEIDSETIFIYEGWSILVERTTNSAGDRSIRRYVHGPVTDEIIRQDFFSSGGSIKNVFHHHDLPGSNLCLSDSTGNAVEYYRYIAFGFPTILDTNLNAIPATKFGNRHLYTGREWLRELRISDHRNRHYTAHLARWTSTDPITWPFYEGMGT